MHKNNIALRMATSIEGVRYSRCTIKSEVKFIPSEFVFARDARRLPLEWLEVIF